MFDEPQTRRSLLQKIGATSTIGLQTSSGCLGESTFDSLVTGRTESTSGLPDRPYTVMTPTPETVNRNSGYSVLSKQPLRATHLAERFGDMYPFYRHPERNIRDGSVASVSMRGPTGTYLRVPVDREHYRSTLERGATPLETYRGFERFLFPAGPYSEVVAFTDEDHITVRNPDLDDFEEASRDVIDLHHGDGPNWRKTRDSYADLVTHLPQGLLTQVYPDGRGRVLDPEQAFGQTALLPDGSGSTVHLRTVIVYPVVDELARVLVSDYLSRTEIGRFPVTDPEIEWVDRVAIITDTCDVTEVIW